MQGQAIEVKPLERVQLDLDSESTVTQKSNFKALHFQQRQMESKRAVYEDCSIEQESNGVFKDKLETTATAFGKIKTSDGIALWYRRYENKNAKANIVILHSFNEHIGFYEHVAKRLHSSEYTVICFDQRGIGQSEGTKGHLKSVDRYILGIVYFLFLISFHLNRL